jgi:hypothetical protein
MSYLIYNIAAADIKIFSNANIYAVYLLDLPVLSGDA